MAYKHALTMLIPLMIAGCSLMNNSEYDGKYPPNKSEASDNMMHILRPDPYYDKENMSPEQRREISKQLRAERLEARGRRDNSTDSGDGLGQPVPHSFYN